MRFTKFYISSTQKSYKLELLTGTCGHNESNDIYFRVGTISVVRERDTDCDINLGVYSWNSYDHLAAVNVSFLTATYANERYYSRKFQIQRGFIGLGTFQRQLLYDKFDIL